MTISREDPAILTARAAVMRAGVSRAGFAPRDTKDGTLSGTVAGEYVATMEAYPTATVTTEVPA